MQKPGAEYCRITTPERGMELVARIRTPAQAVSAVAHDCVPAAPYSSEGEPLDRHFGEHVGTFLDVVGGPGVSRGELCV